MALPVLKIRAKLVKLGRFLDVPAGRGFFAILVSVSWDAHDADAHGSCVVYLELRNPDSTADSCLRP